MTMTDAQRLADIRQRSIETWRIHDLPPFDPTTGEPKPFRIVSKLDEDVKFLLEKLGLADDEIARLEDMLEQHEYENDRVENGPVDHPYR